MTRKNNQNPFYLKGNIIIGRLFCNVSGSRIAPGILTFALPLPFAVKHSHVGSNDFRG
jgi:hypothetical protein